MIRLGVNVDHVATLRQVRKETWPDPAEAALVVARAGADQITIHLREDRRHIQDRDVRLILQQSPVPVNLEMAAVAAMVSFATEHQPSRVTLVPERREEVTTEGGLNLFTESETIRSRVRLLKDAGIIVSAFIDGDASQVRQAHKLGFDAIELHTGPFAAAVEYDQQVEQELEKLRQAARLAIRVGMEVAAGHGLTLRSTEILVKVQEITEFNIGHALVADALYCGLSESVRKFLQRMGRPS